MRWSDHFVRFFQRYMPSPFTLAILLTILTYFLALALGEAPTEDVKAFAILDYWQQGFWELLSFAMQMMLMLILGHILALSRPVNYLIRSAVSPCTNSARAAAFVSFFTMLVAFFNWGLGLIFGAVFARQVGEYAASRNASLNYPLIGAAGYSGLMVWHGGLSGSAPLKVNEAGHFLAEKTGFISMNDTLFSSMNISVSLVLLIVIPLLMYWLGKAIPGDLGSLAGLKPTADKKPVVDQEKAPAEWLDSSFLLPAIAGLAILGVAGWQAIELQTNTFPDFSFITPNYINFLLFGLCIVFHGSFRNFLKAADDAIRDGTGILIQFPLYAGIMGMMKYSGLIHVFSDAFIHISNENSFPILAFFSAGLVNFFVPSGGGQWAVQGPILVDAALALNVPLAKTVMALAYGDQLTNMIQPFWALPLLGITGLKAAKILPYSMMMMIAAMFIFILGLTLF